MTHAADDAPSHSGEEPEITLRQSVRGGLRVAGYFALVAIATIALGAIVILLKDGEIGSWEGGWGAMPGELAVIFIGYFAAGALGGVVFWLFRKRRPSLAGWTLTTAAVGGTIMATFVVCGTLAYLVLGVRLMVVSSAPDLMATTPYVVLGALAGPFFWWLDELRWRRTHARHGAELPA